MYKKYSFPYGLPITVSAFKCDLNSAPSLSLFCLLSDSLHVCVLDLLEGASQIAVDVWEAVPQKR